MIVVYVLIAVALVIAGALLVILAVISLAIHREEAAYTMTEPTADPVARWVRATNGVYVRVPGVARQVREDLARLGAGGVITR